ncbi:MAG: hypothetical protein F6K09_06040 [Merismopedia sp. SIO2A8]|nr:hypothetical protein [Merismopedia sp. SIO2A8]
MTHSSFDSVDKAVDPWVQKEFRDLTSFDASPTFSELTLTTDAILNGEL